MIDNNYQKELHIKTHRLRKEECSCNLCTAVIPIYLTKTVLKTKSNATFYMKEGDLDESKWSR